MKGPDGNQAEPTRVHAGDLLFLVEDVWHLFSGDREPGGVDTQLEHDGGESITSMICGSIEFASVSAATFLRALPPFLLLPSRLDAKGDALSALALLMAAELDAAEPGYALVLDRLSDVLVLQVLRHAIRERIVGHGVLSAMTDHRLFAAVVAMYTQPEQPWTLDGLARHAGLSRSVLARRFQDAVGVSPMHHLADIRMILAERWLHDGRQSMATIAERLGYSSEAALSRAFKRIRGVSPGLLRRR